MHNLLPALMQGVTTASGPKQIALVTGVSDNLYALDAETGAQLGNIISKPIGRLRRAVGAAQASFAPAASPRRRSSGLQGRLANTSSMLRPGWHIAPRGPGDGRGDRPACPIHAAQRQALRAEFVQNVIYTHTAQGCGGNPNMVYIYDLATDRVGSWGPAGGGMWGAPAPRSAARV